ncbi:MAG TPA: DNA polymerase IV [Candidatus Paceibacterota bacterium]
MIMHLDGDSFFASVEAAKDPSLRGKPVVTGFERGIATAMSKEAKSLGITRAMPVFRIRKEFPQVRIVESDYDAYAVFSRRMFDIVRRYTDVVEEYSIDECFADFSDIPEFAPAADGSLESARPILEKIKKDIARELGISVSLGLASTRVLAKTASKSQKPNGLTILPMADVEKLLDRTPIGSVWGIGSATTISFRKLGINTALDFARKSADWVREHFSKLQIEMWYELNGTSINRVGEHAGQAQKSIMKTRSFHPHSSDEGYIFSELSKNIEGACHRARGMGLCAREFSVFIKTKEFWYKRDSVRLQLATDDPFIIIAEAKKLFGKLFDPGHVYRASGVTLCNLVPASGRQEDLFGAAGADRSRGEAFKAVDQLNKKYGRDLIHVASSLRAIQKEERGEKSLSFLPPGVRRRLSVPFIGDVL